MWHWRENDGGRQPRRSAVSLPRNLAATGLVALAVFSAAVTAEALRDWLNDRVEAKFQRVSGVVIMEEFPRNVAGKTLKRVMRQNYWEDREVKL